MRLDQQNDDIGVRRPAPGRRNHRAVEPPARPEEARRIHEDELRVALHRHAPDARARRLHLVRDDRDLRAHHAVEQRRLARVGLSDQGDETGAGGHGVVTLKWGQRVAIADPARLGYTGRLRDG